MIVLEWMILLLFPCLLSLVYHYLWFSRIIFPDQCAQLKDGEISPFATLRGWLAEISGRGEDGFYLCGIGSLKPSLQAWKRYGLLLAGAILLVGVAHLFDLQVIWQDLLFLLFVLPLIVFDKHYYLLPNTLTLPLLWLGIILAGLGLSVVSLEESIGGVVLGYGVLSLLYYGGYAYYQYEAIGRGDIKFVAALAAWIGLSQLLSFLLFSSLLGIAFFVVIRCAVVFKRTRSSRGERVGCFPRMQHELKAMIPFGPSLGISGIIFYFIVRVVG